ncbi:hypothetical protein ACOME3_009033 [Neoechinorhynchus agilis]
MQSVNREENFFAAGYRAPFGILLRTIMDRTRTIFPTNGISFRTGDVVIRFWRKPSMDLGGEPEQLHRELRGPRTKRTVLVREKSLARFGRVSFRLHIVV